MLPINISFFNAIKQFYSLINTVIVDINDFCVCCNLFLPLKTNTLLTKIYSKFILFIIIAVIVKNNLDSCEYTNNNSNFCKSCYSIIIIKMISIFRFANCINVLSCQKYPNTLSSLTLIKKEFIA